MAYSIDTTKYINKMKDACKRNGVNINLINPQTIQDKLAWLNIYETNPLKVQCADKVLVHDYVKEVLGEDICIPILKVYDNTRQINWDELPNRFVLKCNHGSGMNIIVKDKSKLDKGAAISKLNKWMTDDFSMRNGFEAHYHDIKHKIFAEEYKENKSDGLFDYKFWCFNGEPKFYTINDGNGHGRWMKFYDMNQNVLPFKRADFTGEPNIKVPQPINFEQMIESAKKLASNFAFVRVDFYEVNGQIFLGELTFTPGAFFFKYVNPADNLKIGNLLTLPSK